MTCPEHGSTLEACEHVHESRYVAEMLRGTGLTAELTPDGYVISDSHGETVSGPHTSADIDELVRDLQAEAGR